ncbi:MAG: pyridoxal-phosphate dependent enzyme, partial [Proteobacteria bacterium]
MIQDMSQFPPTVTAQSIADAYQRLQSVVTHTPLQFNPRLSEQYGAQIYFKREDLQIVRSYKLRGAYNLMSALSPDDRAKGVVC